PHRRERRHRYPLPDLVRTEFSEDSWRTADVIGVTVSQNDPFKPSHTNLSENGRYHPIADIERSRAAQPSSIHQHRFAARPPEKRGVALSDIEKRHMQASVAIRHHQAPRLRGDPHSGSEPTHESCTSHRTRSPEGAHHDEGDVVENDRHKAWSSDSPC